MTDTPESDYALGANRKKGKTMIEVDTFISYGSLPKLGLDNVQRVLKREGWTILFTQEERVHARKGGKIIKVAANGHVSGVN